jgi:hypothetical protein
MPAGFASHRRSPKPDFWANRAQLIREQDFRRARSFGAVHGERSVHMRVHRATRGGDAGVISR